MYKAGALIGSLSFTRTHTHAHTLSLGSVQGRESESRHRPTGGLLPLQGREQPRHQVRPLSIPSPSLFLHESEWPRFPQHRTLKPPSPFFLSGLGLDCPWLGLDSERERERERSRLQLGAPFCLLPHAVSRSRLSSRAVCWRSTRDWRRMEACSSIGELWAGEGSAVLNLKPLSLFFKIAVAWSPMFLFSCGHALALPLHPRMQALPRRLPRRPHALHRGDEAAAGVPAGGRQIPRAQRAQPGRPAVTTA